MTSLIDRIILFTISILMFDWSQVDYTKVCLILVALILECIMFYFESKRICCILATLCIIITLMQPQFVMFMPIFVYEVVRADLFVLIPVDILVFFIINIEKNNVNLWSRETLYGLIFILLGIYSGIKTSRELQLKNKLHNIRDEHAYLRMKDKQNREEFIKNQDYEIHAATLSERNRIAREIHDHVGHMLSRSILQLGAILAINKQENLSINLRGLKDTLDTAMNNIRESVHDLKDEAVDLEYMVNEIIREYKTLEIAFDYDMSKNLSKDIKYCFMAIVKEALTNTVKHSDGNKVSIVMIEHPALYQVSIEDNGSNRISNIDKSGIGLENMRERISAFNGNIRFSNEKGFKIFISIPKEM